MSIEVNSQTLLWTTSPLKKLVCVLHLKLWYSILPSFRVPHQRLWCEPPYGLSPEDRVVVTINNQKKLVLSTTWEVIKFFILQVVIIIQLNTCYCVVMALHYFMYNYLFKAIRLPCRVFIIYYYTFTHLHSVVIGNRHL